MRNLYSDFYVRGTGKFFEFFPNGKLTHLLPLPYPCYYDSSTDINLPSPNQKHSSLSLFIFRIPSHIYHSLFQNHFRLLPSLSPLTPLLCSIVFSLIMSLNFLTIKSILVCPKKILPYTYTPLSKSMRPFTSPTSLSNSFRPMIPTFFKFALKIFPGILNPSILKKKYPPYIYLLFRKALFYFYLSNLSRLSLVQSPPDTYLKSFGVSYD